MNESEQPAPTQTAATPSGGRRVLRWLRWPLRGLALLAIVLGIAVTVILLSESARRPLLAEALRRVEESAPGTLRLDARWPRLGAVEVSGLVWTDGADTLGTLENATLDVDLRAALGRRLRVRRVTVGSARFDLDAMQALLASSSDAAPSSTAEPSSEIPWFSPGRWQSIPDAAVDSIEVRDVRVTSQGEVYSLDELSAAVDLGAQPVSPWLRLALRAHAPDLASVAWRVESARTDSLVLQMSPLTLGRAPFDPRKLDLVATVSTSNAQVETMLRGESADLDWTGVFAAGEAGRIQTRGGWKQDRAEGRLSYVAPDDVGLIQTLLARTGADSLPVVRRLFETWPTDSPYSLSAEGDWSRERFAVAAHVDLPGPTLLLDPPSAAMPWDGYDRLAARVEIAGRGDGAPLDFTLSLAENPWLDRGRVVGSWDGEEAKVDTLDIVREGLTLAGRGRGGVSDVDAEFRFVIDSAQLGRFAVVEDSVLSFLAEGTIAAKGTWPLPDLVVDLDGSARGAFGTLPEVTLRAQNESGQTRMRARMPQGATLADRVVQSADIDWDGSIDAETKVVDGHAAVSFEMDDLAMRLRGDLLASEADGFLAEIEELDLRVAQDRWTSTGPFVARVNPAGEARLSDLDLVGELGHLRIDGSSVRDSLQGDLDAQLVLSRALLETLLPDSLHAAIPADTTRIALRARAAGPLRSPTVAADLDLQLAGAERIGPLSAEAQVWVRGEGVLADFGAPDDLARRGVGVEVRIDHEQRAWFRTSARIAGVADLRDASFARAARDTARIEVWADSVEVDQLLALARIDEGIHGLVDGRATLHVTDRAGLADVDLSVAGLSLTDYEGQTWESDVALTLHGAGDLDQDMQLDAFTLETDFGTLSGSGSLVAEEIEADAVGEFSLPRQLIETFAARMEAAYEFPADTLAVRFELHADGPLDGPSSYAEYEAHLLGGKQIPPLDLRGAAWLRGERAGPWPTPPPEDLPTQGVFARMQLSEPGGVWFDADAVLPVEVGVRPTVWMPIEGEPMRVTLDTGALDIARVATLADLDAFGRFTGDLRVHFDARSDDGKVIDVSGSMNSDRMRADLVDGSWVEATADVRIGGTMDQPSVDGGVVVNGGVLRMPEVPPTLHDVQGSALLWGDRPQTPRVTNGATARADSAVVVQTAPASAPLLPALNVTLNIPGNLRLVGLGLDIELSGSLTARNDNEEIGVVGTLQATRGSYQFLGRRFEVRTGVVSFFGDLDPELDLRLVTTLQSINYFVHIGGTAQQPRFELSSEPAMSEGDIVSALLFGRPLNELDEGQTALLRERTQQIAAQLGTRLLAQRVGQQVGVDILAVRTATDGEGQALVVGKYLRPDVLVQYERVLEEGAAALVRLEYALNRFFKIETTASQGEHSGVELKWTKDY